jgi:hypothetical protein
MTAGKLATKHAAEVASVSQGDARINAFYIQIMGAFVLVQMQMPHTVKRKSSLIYSQST